MSIVKQNNVTDLEVDTQYLLRDIALISPKGCLDTYTYDKFEEAIKHCFNQHKYKLIIDLSQVDWIGCPGAGILIESIIVAQENRGNIFLVRPNQAVKGLFALLGLTHIFHITNDLESALKIFTQTGNEVVGQSV